MVALDFCGQSAVDTRLKVFQIKNGLCILPLKIRHMFSIWRRRWHNRSTSTTDVPWRLSGLKIMAHYIKKLSGRIFTILPNSTRCNVIGVVEIFAIGRKSRVSHIFLSMRPISTLSDHHTITARAVIHPDFTGRDRTRRHKAFSDGYVVTIRTPAGRMNKRCFLIANLTRIVTIWIH